MKELNTRIIGENTFKGSHVKTNNSKDMTKYAVIFDIMGETSFNK